MLLALDTETTGLDSYHGCRPFMIIGCDGEINYHWVGQVNPYTREVFWDESDIEEVQELINKATKIVFHNSLFDVRMLKAIDITIPWDKIEDTLLAAHCINSAKTDKDDNQVGRTLGLKNLAIEYLHYWDDDEKQLELIVKQRRTQNPDYAIARRGHHHFPALKGSNAKWWAMDYWLAPEECLEYGLGDVERTWLLWDAFKPALTADGLWGPYKLRKELLPIIAELVDYGMYCYKEQAEKFVSDCLDRMEQLRWQIKDEADMKYKFDPNKRDHLIDLIHTRLGIPVAFRTSKDAPAVHKEALKFYTEQYDLPAIKFLRERNVIDTEVRYVKSYIDWCDENNRIHSNLNPTGTRETRQSSSDPNQQNIKGGLKQFFGPEPGRVWLDMDFVNIELRIWAYSVGNAELIEAFEKGISVHKLIMEELFPSDFRRFEADPNDEKLKKKYRDVKAGNFGIIYGATEKKADETYGLKGAYKRIVKRFPGIKEFTDGLIKQVYINSDKFLVPSVITLGGYRLVVPLDEPFKACNYFVQGSAGMLMTYAMIAVHNNKEYQENDCHMINQTHDNLIVDMPIHPKIKRTIDSITMAMEESTMDIFTFCPVDYEIKHHEDDIDNPLIEDYTLPF